MIELDISRASQKAIGAAHGFDLDRLFAEYQPKVSEALSWLWTNPEAKGEWRRWTQLGHWTDLADQVTAYAKSVHGQFDQLVVIGIGGSALGAQAMFEALLPSYWNERSGDQRCGCPKVYFIDNVDPDKLKALFEVLDLKRTLVNVISKSGTTAESMAGYLWLKVELEKAVGAESLPKHLVMTTDPVKGILRKIVADEGYTAFEVPDDVGGRFSVFSAVGMLPAAIVGLPVAEMFQGIRDLMPLLQEPSLAKNPVAQSTVIQMAAYKAGKPVSVLMPYSAKLSLVADWYVQLWAESLGKKFDKQGQVVHEGATPLKAVGVTDQHSQVQLFNEGPFDKVFTFVRLGKFHQELTIPNGYPDIADLSYLGNQTFETLLQAEADATRASVTKNQRPNVTLTLPELTPYYFAQLLYFLEVQTALAGHLLNIDPFDQPGVELAKQYTCALMGRPGFEHLIAEAKGQTALVC